MGHRGSQNKAASLDELIKAQNRNVGGTTWAVRLVIFLMFAWGIAGGVVSFVQVTVAGCPAEKGSRNLEEAAELVGYRDNEHLWTNITANSEHAVCALIFAREYGSFPETVFFVFVAWMLALMVTMDRERLYLDLKWSPTAMIGVMVLVFLNEYAVFGY